MSLSSSSGNGRVPRGVTALTAVASVVCVLLTGVLAFPTSVSALPQGCRPADRAKVYAEYNLAAARLDSRNAAGMSSEGATVFAATAGTDEATASAALIEKANNYLLEWSCVTSRFEFWPYVMRQDKVQASPGEVVHVYGQQLSHTTDVRVAGVAAAFRIIDDSHLEVSAPAGDVYGRLTASRLDLKPLVAHRTYLAVGRGQRAAQTARACPPGRVAASPFLDVPATGAHSAHIACAAWRGLTQGTTATTFDPKRPVTRAQMATLAFNLIYFSCGFLGGSPEPPFDDTKDVPQHEQQIHFLQRVGIVEGTGPRTYSPHRPVTRGQAAKILARTAAHVTGSALPSSYDVFGDDAGQPFQGPVNQLAQAGVLTGSADGTANQQGVLSREQLATLLVRALDLHAETGVIYPCRDYSMDPQP